MRIKEYERVTSLQEDDVLVIDGNRGVKSIDPKAMNQEILLNKLKEEYWAFVNKLANASEEPYIVRRNLYRGKNLGSSLTSKQKEAITNNTFDDMFVGDFWMMGNTRYNITDFNYWSNTGDSACTVPHVVVTPHECLYNHVMNDTHTTEGGYVGSKMRTSGLDQARAAIKSDFGAEHILVHRELFTNSVVNGIANAGEWIDSDIDLMNEIMVYGCLCFSPTSTGQTIPYNYTVDCQQLALFRLKPSYKNEQRQWYWLRDVVSASRFAIVDGHGHSGCYDAGYSGGVRPVFGIKAG